MIRFTRAVITFTILSAILIGMVGFVSVAVNSSVAAAAAPPTVSEAKSIFYALLKERNAAVENNLYTKIEPLYLAR